MAQPWDPALSFARGMNIGRGWRHENEDRERQRVLQSREDEAYRQEQLTQGMRALSAFYNTAAYDPETDTYDDSRLESPDAIQGLDLLIKQYPILGEYAGQQASEGEGFQNDPRRLVGVQPMPDGRGGAAIMFARNGSPGGPETEGGAYGPGSDDARVVRSDGPRLGGAIRSLLGVYDPEGTRLRQEHARGRAAAGRQAGLFDALASGAEPAAAPPAVAPAAPQQSPSPRGPQSALSQREIGEQAQQIPDPRERAAFLQSQGVELPNVVRSQYGLDAASGAPGQNVHPEVRKAWERDLSQATEQVASLEARVAEINRRSPGYSQARDEAQAALDSARTRLENATRRLTPPAPAQTIPLDESPAGAPLESDAPSDQFEAQAERFVQTGKVSSAAREAFRAAVAAGDMTAKEAVEQMRGPGGKFTVAMNDKTFILSEHGKVIWARSNPAQPMTPAEEAAARKEGMAYAKYMQEWIDGQAGNAFDRDKQRGDYNWMRRAISISIGDGLLSPDDPANSTAMIDLAKQAIDADKAGWAWFKGQYRDYPSLTMPILAMGLSEGGKPDIRKTMEALTPSQAALDAAARAGISPHELVVGMANEAQRLAGEGMPTKEAILRVRQMAEARAR